MARISGVDIPNQKRVEIALTYIYGIGLKSSQDILAKTGIDPDKRAKDLTEDEISKPEDFTLSKNGDRVKSYDGNAKKIVEVDLKAKGTPLHDASVVGDTVGDPFKDTSGPSLNILIKLMSMVSIVMAGLTVAFI